MKFRIKNGRLLIFQEIDKLNNFVCLFIYDNKINVVEPFRYEVYSNEFLTDIEIYFDERVKKQLKEMILLFKENKYNLSQLNKIKLTLEKVYEKYAKDFNLPKLEISKERLLKYNTFYKKESSKK